MAKVIINAVKSARVRISNASDKQRQFNIEADVEMFNQKLVNVSNGEVTQNEKKVGSFSFCGDNNLTITYMNVPLEQQHVINVAISQFIEDAKVCISVEPLTI